MLGWTVGLEAKKKDKAEQVQLLLDDTKLEQADYYDGLKVVALKSFVDAVQLPKTEDMKTIKSEMDIANINSQWSEECASVALGYRQEFVKSVAEGKAKASGNTGGSDNLDISDSVKQDIAKLKSGETKMSEMQQTFFLSSLVHLASAVYIEKTVLEGAKMFVETAKGAKGPAAMKYAKDLPVASKIVADLPGTLATQLATLKDFMAIATTQNIEVPKDVTSKMNF
jgi:hypothetical protein